jgi:hypothetical protein
LSRTLLLRIEPDFPPALFDRLGVDLGAPELQAALPARNTGETQMAVNYCLCVMDGVGVDAVLDRLFRAIGVSSYAPVWMTFSH